MQWEFSFQTMQLFYTPPASRPECSTPGVEQFPIKKPRPQKRAEAKESEITDTIGGGGGNATVGTNEATDDGDDARGHRPRSGWNRADGNSSCDRHSCNQNHHTGPSLWKAQTPKQKSRNRDSGTSKSS